VESVAWISELKNTLSLPFFLAAAWCIVRFEQGSGRKFYFAALGFFLAASAWQEFGGDVPCVMLLHAWWLRGRIAWRDILHSAPFFLISLMLGLITLHFQSDRAIGSEAIPIRRLGFPVGYRRNGGAFSPLQDHLARDIAADLSAVESESPENLPVFAMACDRGGLRIFLVAAEILGPKCAAGLGVLPHHTSCPCSALWPCPTCGWVGSPTTFCISQ
jgi:hypothetical protein